MYYIHMVKDAFKIAPEYFDKPIEKVAIEVRQSVSACRCATS